MMVRLIDDLIDFSSMGKRDVRKQTTNMKELDEVCIEELALAWPEGKFQIDAGTLPLCMGDSDLIKQVWLNLISNAMKYSSRQEEPRIAIGAMEEATGTVYFVRDNGPAFHMRYTTTPYTVSNPPHT